MFSTLHVLALVGPCPVLHTIAAAVVGQLAHAVRELATTTTTEE